MRLRNSIFGGALSLAALVGCDWSTSTSSISGSPYGLTCNSTLTTTGDVEDIGFSTIQVGDKENKSWLDTPPTGFEHYDGHAGGLGDTLELMGCNDSVYGIFIGENLWHIAVRGPWNHGTTNTGINIGSSLADFLNAYPGAQKRKTYNYTVPPGDVWTTGHLKVAVSNNALFAMEVSTTNYDGDDPNDAICRVGPDGTKQWKPPTKQKVEDDLIQLYMRVTVTFDEESR